MKKMMKKVMGAMVALVLVGIMAVIAAESKYDVHATGGDPSITFGPKTGGQMVKHVTTSCDYPLGSVKFYVTAGKYAISTTNTTTQVLITNPAASGGVAVTNNDIIVYVHKDGTLDKATVSSSTSTSVTMSAASTVAWASGDYLYDMTQGGQIIVADNTAANGTNKLTELSGEVFAVPGDSPLYLVLSSTTNTALSATVE